MGRPKFGGGKVLSKNLNQYYTTGNQSILSTTGHFLTRVGSFSVVVGYLKQMHCPKMAALRHCKIVEDTSHQNTRTLPWLCITTILTRI